MNQFTTILRGLLLLLFFATVVEATAQTYKPSKVIKPVYFDKSQALRDIPVGDAVLYDRSGKVKVIKNKLDLGVMTEEMDDPDPVLQNSIKGRSGSEPVVGSNFGGVNNRNGSIPPDTQGDVGLSHYMQMVNLSFAIWDKEGELLYGPANNSYLWNGFVGPWSGSNDGDAIVVYDEWADRWIASQFSWSNGTDWELIAVSVTGDPTGEWYRYAYSFDNLPDYPKFGVWPDAYYFTVNEFHNGNSVGASVCALDREAMINGDPDAEMVYFDMNSNVFSLLPGDADGEIPPPDGSPAYMIGLQGNTSLVSYKVEIDWNNTANSSITFDGYISVAQYSTNGISINQPGTSQKLSTLSGRLMYRLQYRNFGDYEVMLTSHTVNAGGSQAGVRWYELRKDENSDDKWAVYQQGTYAPDDGDNRWMGSIAMNKFGDIGIGYSVSSANTFPSIRFAGQTSGAPEGLGILDIPETIIKEGNNSQTGESRWGDYSMMSIDPSDGESFWYTTEYSKGGWNWDTQIASFTYAQAPTANFTSNEVIIPVGETVDFEDLTSGLPTTWEWTFEGGSPAESADENPENITYNTEGTFAVTLVAENNLGSDAELKESYITTSTTILPDVSFKASSDFVCTGTTIYFEDMTQYSPNYWEWEFEPSDYTFVDGTDKNSQNPHVVFNDAANYSVKLTAWNLNGQSTEEQSNAVLAGGYTPFFYEGFESNNFSNQHWEIINSDKSFTWEMFETGGTTPGNISAGINFKKDQTIGERDRLISPALNLIDMSSAVLQFEHAYAQFAPGYSDSLIIYVSTDCDENWTRIYTGGEDGNGSLATHQSTDDFWPETESDWCLSGWGSTCITVDLTPWVGESGVRIAFEAYSNYGNPLFIDNVIVSQFVGQDELTGNDTELLIYPNPTNSTFKVVLPDNQIYTNLQLVNHLGQLIYSVEIPTSVSTMEIKPEANWDIGIYFLKVNGSKTITRKVILY